MLIPENNIELIYNFIPAILLYAELHFRLKMFKGRYFINEPEILSDLPIRIEPGKKLPILILIKDAHIFPIKLQNVEVILYKKHKMAERYDKEYNLSINKYWWHDTIFINVDNICGTIQVDIIFTYEANSNTKTCKIHNYPLSTHRKLETYISEHAYPNDGNVVYGDLHYHTNLTEDMVEFGAPIKSTLNAAEAMGLDFFCNTDHSYDLDDKPGSWTETDPKLEKWNNSRIEIEKLNAETSNSSYIIPSEELSLHNSNGKNIHALILNNKSFLAGAGDGAEQLFNYDAEYDTINLHNNMEDNSLCIAAHPFVKTSLLQRLLLRRGKWEKDDILPENMIGLQILNGELDKTFYLSLKIWIKLLLEGYHKYIFAGNDAHGNFNQYRQISIPMVSLKEQKKQLFGQFRTGVLINGKSKNVASTLDSLKKGNCFITTGPLLNIIFRSDKSIYNMGSTVYKNSGVLEINIKSSPEFGVIKQIILKQGIIGKKTETDHIIVANLQKFQFNHKFEIYASVHCYYRCIAEFEIVRNIKSCAFSNPIWLKPVR